MSSPETTLAREGCELHPDRAAVGRCRTCGRTVCLDCAIPFRGDIRCERCAAIELGEPAPAPVERRRRLASRHVVLALSLIAGAATIPPWHRSGTLTTPLSAWSFGLEPWAASGCAGVAIALMLALVATLRGPSARGTLGAATVFCAFAAVAVGVTLATAPAFFSSTAAPFVALTSAAAAAVLGTFSLVRGARP